MLILSLGLIFYLILKRWDKGEVPYNSKLAIYRYMKLSNKAVVKGIGKDCPKCFNPMERRKHPDHWKSKKSYYFIEWDYCVKCNHVQHYDEFKSSEWQEIERQEDFFRNIK